MTGGLALAVFGVIAVVDPNQPGHYPVCPWLLLTGRFCPGCGGLRALHDLAHGQIVLAASSNLLVTTAVPVLVLLWASWTWRRLSGRVSGLRFPALLGWSLFLLVLVFWGLRNLPMTSWLAP